MSISIWNEADRAMLNRVRDRFALKEDASYDHKGHSYRSNTDPKTIIDRYYALTFYGMDKDELARLDACSSKPNPPILIDYCGGHSCHNCEWDGAYTFDGETFSATEECSHPNGVDNVAIELNIPSGKMVFANNLRQWFKVHGDFDINKNSGKLDTTLAYEKVGMAYGFVGNTCPGVYRLSESKLTISSYGLPDKEDDSEDIDDSELIQPPGEDVGGICTDLWWYCIVDLEDFKHRFFDLGGTEKQFQDELKHCDVVDVKPGVYQVIHNFIDDYNTVGAPTHYAEIKWLRDPEHRSLYEAYKNLNYTIGQCYLATVAKYPTLYGFDKNELPVSLSMTERVERLMSFSKDKLESSVAIFYSYIFHNEREDDWHLNGWVCSNPIAIDTPDFVLPELTQAYAWYPASAKYSNLYAIGRDNNPLPLNESFLAAAHQVIHSMLKFGVKPFGLQRRSNSSAEMKEHIETAQYALRGISNRYLVPEYLKEFLD